MTIVAEPRTIVPPLKLTDGELKFYRDEGYLQIPGLLSDETAAALREEVMEIMEAIGGYQGSRLKQTSEHLEGSLLDRFIHSPDLLAIASQLLGGPSSLYLPFTAVKGVGGGVFNFHQDNNYTHYENGLLGINLWFALADMTPENGCLMIVPRSHLAGQLESEETAHRDGHRKVKHEPSDFLPVRMRAGDCIAFSRLTVHGSGPNTTDRPRIGYAVQFFRNDARFHDRQTGELKSLVTDSPQRAHTRPVKVLSIPAGKVDGH